MTSGYSEELLSQNFAGKHFVSEPKLKKTPIWAEIVQKWLFLILTVDVSTKNDYKLDEILRNFGKEIFWNS